MIDDDKAHGVSREQRVDQLQSDLWFLFTRKMKRAARWVGECAALYWLGWIVTYYVAEWLLGVSLGGQESRSWLEFRGTHPAGVRPPFGHLGGGVACDRMGSALPIDAVSANKASPLMQQNHFTGNTPINARLWIRTQSRPLSLGEG